MWSRVEVTELMPVSVLRAQGACASVQRGISFWFLERSLKILTQKTKKNSKKPKQKQQN